MLVFKTILVAIDSSKLADEVVAAIHQLQITSEVTIVLAQVMPAMDSDAEVDVTLPGSAVGKAAYPEVEHYLQSYRERLPKVTTHIEIVSGEPAEEIIRLANIYSSDLIVLGSRGLTGMSRILQGSVSSQVVEEAPCSVMVIKPASSDKK